MNDNIQDNNSTGGSRHLLAVVLALLLSVTMVVFALQNATEVHVQFLFWSVEVALSLLLITTLLSGVIIAIIFSIPVWYRRRKTIAELKKQLRN